MAGIDTANVGPGFVSPVHDAQGVFRAVMGAMARPGSVVHVDGLPLPPQPLNATAAAVCLALADFDTPVWLDAGATAAVSHLRFHTGCPFVDQTDAAHFVIVTDVATLPPLSRLRLGSDERPDRSATLLLQVAGLREGEGWRLSGPGIDGTRQLAIDGVGADLLALFQDNHALFPCGVDTLLCMPDRLAALPRTTWIEG